MIPEPITAAPATTNLPHNGTYNSKICYETSTTAIMILEIM